ncbi:hypothetical protein MAPG_06329 [Magnaporthiopsis poae ATCC 64411]|uniref:RNA polymerase II degradation factor 1 n=1 Tax=Magnaporthiopsis poae (strain ATCC 64411 / 73-15) TaxID=644358 RepID=A0A0C4E1Q9_MAGP6|nr:hypothetical protein MAPG_06329 [Magnaporthiopsis poae ATCC 64411]
MSSEVQSRPAASRGRGAGRGGRGGYSRGGARQQVRSPNGDSKHFDSLDSVEDEGEIGELKKRYGSKTSLIKEMFPDWSDVDILFALHETDGDENLTVTRIAEGTISQWGEVSKQKKDRSKPKASAKDATFTTTTGDAGPGYNRAPRGGRIEGTRGRGRGIEREPPQKTWASMLRQSTAPKPAPPKPKAAPAPPPPAEVIEPLPPVAEPVPADEPAPAPIEMPAEPVAKETPQAPIPEIPTVVPEVVLPPSQDQLTETNLEQITDISNPPDTETARSEAADSWDPRTAAALSATATPLSASQQQHQAQQQAARTATSGYATTALKATERSATRTPNFGRRLLDQEEAVRMPGNREVDRATVQFGALNFSGLEEDIDGDREEPETRTQPPDDSPVSHPRTSLPVAQPAAVPDSFAAQKPVAAAVPVAAPPTGPAAGTSHQPLTTSVFDWSSTDIPPAATPSALAPQQPAAAAPAPQPQQSHIPSQPSQAQGFGRFAQDQQQQSYGQKSFDAFAQQNATSAPPAGQHQFDGFPTSQAQTQAHSQASVPTPAQAPAAALSSAPNDFSSYYTADHQGRGPYSYYNQNYSQQQQSMQGQQDGIASRSLGGYSAAQTENLSQYPQSGVPAPASSRFSAGSALDAQGSGNNTPNPAAQSQQQPGQTAQSQSHVQQQAQHANQYPYGQHPYSYNGPYYAYMNQYQTGYGQGGYGAPYGKQAGVYGQPNQYGMSPNAPYDHSSSGASGFGQQSSLHRGDSLGAGGLGDYGRASAQQSSNQGLGNGGFGGMHDSFGRNASSSYQSQAGQGFGNQGQQPGGAPSGNDDLKPFGDSKAAGGPSPGAGGYGLGGAAAQGHGNSPYGAYGNQGFSGGNYYGNQPRGWGGNYH